MKIKNLLLENKKYFLMSFLILFSIFFSRLALASDTFSSPVSNQPCSGIVHVNFNKTTYAPGEKVGVSGYWSSLGCNGGGYIDNSWITASLAYNDSDFPYKPVPQAPQMLSFERPDNGSLTVYLKYGFSGTVTASGQSQIVAGVETPGPGAMTVTITASPQQVPYGLTSKIHWTSFGAQSCDRTDPISGLSTTGDIVSPPILGDYVVEIHCTGPDPEHPPKGVRATTGRLTITVLTATPDVKIDVQTGDASNLKDTSVTLSGSASPLGNNSTSGYFRYSKVEDFPPIFCNDIYGSKMRATKEINLGGSNSPVTFSSDISGLESDSTYYYCAVASSNNAISYGGVKSFTTRLASGLFSVTTGDPVVVDGTSVYLNGYFNTAVAANTYFEYRKRGIQSSTSSVIQGGASASSKYNKNWLERATEKVFAFLNIRKAVAATTSNGSPAYYDWIRVNEESHDANRSGRSSFLLDGLSPSTYYEYRAVIYTDPNSNVVSNTVYGDIVSFHTTNKSTVTPGVVPNGEGYQDPCSNATDVNCNGTGGNWNQNTTGLPDLTTSAVAPTNVIINTPTILSASIGNQGNISTEKDFYGFFQMSLSDRTGITDQTNSSSSSSSTSSIKTQKPPTTTNLGADTTTGSGGTSGGWTTDPPKSSPFNSMNGTSGTNLKTPASKTQTRSPSLVSKLKNFFGIEKAIAASSSMLEEAKKAAALITNTVTDTVSNNSNTVTTIVPTGIATSTAGITNFPAVLVPTLGAGISNTIQLTYTFPSAGVYYFRACADKKDPSDSGLIKELYEDNNCGPWTPIVAGTSLPDNSGYDYGGYTYQGDTYPGYTYGGTSYGGTSTATSTTTPAGTSAIGQTATPPDDAIVRYHEGIEHVFVRQIIKNTNIQSMYGYKDGGDLSGFAWYLADQLARGFGYVSPSGKEIRVGAPDIAAYELRVEGNNLTVYEYYDGKIVNVQSTTTALRNTYNYEYYFNKR